MPTVLNQTHCKCVHLLKRDRLLQTTSTLFIVVDFNVASPTAILLEGSFGANNTAPISRKFSLLLFFIVADLTILL